MTLLLMHILNVDAIIFTMVAIKIGWTFSEMKRESPDLL